MFKFLISCLLVFSGLTNADGHGGGLDQNGGHWDRKAGTYHYHRPRSGSSQSSQSSLVQVNKNTKDISMLGVQVSGILASLTNIQSRISTLEEMVESKLSKLLTRVDSIQKRYKREMPVGDLTLLFPNRIRQQHLKRGNSSFLHSKDRMICQIHMNRKDFQCNVLQ